MAYTQDDRPIGVETPLGPDKLLLISFEGEEQLSRLFHFHLEMLADEKDPIIKADDIVGHPVGFWVEDSDGQQRWFHGIVSRFGYQGTGDRGHRYDAEVVPWFWLLTKSSDCRVFAAAEEASAGKDVKEVIEQLLGDRGFSDFEWKLEGTPRKREFCVQYMETDFDFISRLLEEEGICYYFKHEETKHTLVLSDDTTIADDCGADADVTLLSIGSQPELTDKISDWTHNYRFTSGKWIHTDYDFTKPTTALEVNSKTILKTKDSSKFERYADFGNYAKKADGEALVKRRMEQEESGYNVVAGSSGCRNFSPGGKFELSQHYQDSEQGAYVLTVVRHHANLGGSYVPGASHSDEVYSNDFECIPDTTKFRPPRETPKPRVRGIQTAIVVGPSGQEIHTDKYGRVKVQFHWDRLGKKDEKACCWVRSSHPWTGKNWGAINIPRIGQEVVVDFIDGDPDRPLIVGMLYNADYMPPYSLPDNKTQSGIKTRSSMNGGDDNFNELRFEDKKDEEEIYLHAEKDLNTVVENNETHKVGFDKKDSGDQTIEIYNDRNLTIEEGNETILLKKGNQTTTLDQGNQETTISQGNQETTISLGNQVTNVAAGKATHKATQAIELKVGASSIKIEPAQITIKSPMVKIQGDAMVDIKAPMTSVKGDGTLILKGGITLIN